MKSGTTPAVSAVIQCRFEFTLTPRRLDFCPTKSDLLTLTNGGTQRRTRAAQPTFADVPACVLYGGVAIDVGQQAEAEAVFVVGGVREAIHQDAA